MCTTRWTQHRGSGEVQGSKGCRGSSVRTGRRRGLGAGEMLKRLGAELFGALPGGAVGIEANVGIEVVEERGVVFLLQVDDRLLRGCRARLFRGRESGFEMPARQFEFPQCEESWP